MFFYVDEVYLLCAYQLENRWICMSTGPFLHSVSILQVSAAFLRSWVAWVQEWVFLNCPWSASCVYPGEVLLGSFRCGLAAWPQLHNSHYCLVLVLLTLLPSWRFLTWFELLLPLVMSLLSPSVGTVAAPGGEIFVFFSRVSFGRSAQFSCWSFQTALFCSKKNPQLLSCQA